MNSKYADFEDTLNTDLVVSVSTVVEAAAARVLTSVHLDVLLKALTDSYPDTFAKAGTASAGRGTEDPEYGADFDLVQEMNDQIRVVRALRNKVIDPETGAIKGDHSARDAKELIGSSNTMLASLMKFHDKIVNQDRVRAIEHATIEVVKTLPKESQEKFFEALEQALAAIK